MDEELVCVHWSGLFCRSLRKLGGDCQLRLGRYCSYVIVWNWKMLWSPLGTQIFKCNSDEYKNIYQKRPGGSGRCFFFYCKWKRWKRVYRGSVSLVTGDLQIWGWTSLWTLRSRDLISLSIGCTPNGDVCIRFRSWNPIRSNDIICQMRAQTSATCDNASWSPQRHLWCWRSVREKDIYSSLKIKMLKWNYSSVDTDHNAFD